jgi:hypothetical protein
MQRGAAKRANGADDVLQLGPIPDPARRYQGLRRVVVDHQGKQIIRREPAHRFQSGCPGLFDFLAGHRTGAIDDQRQIDGSPAIGSFQPATFQRNFENGSFSLARRKDRAVEMQAEADGIRGGGTRRNVGHGANGQGDEEAGEGRPEGGFGKSIHRPRFHQKTDPELSRVGQRLVRELSGPVSPGPGRSRCLRLPSLWSCVREPATWSCRHWRTGSGRIPLGVRAVVVGEVHQVAGDHRAGADRDVADRPLDAI